MDCWDRNQSTHVVWGTVGDRGLPGGCWGPADHTISDSAASMSLGSVWAADMAGLRHIQL